MLLQAYDFVYLNQQHGCELQIGGSDQWGNITAGIDLARRMHGVQLYGMTCPLLLKSDGTKMGKTERGAVYLAAERTSPYAFYQYWINVADADAGTCLRFLTELSHEEIEALDESRAEQPHLRESQKRLAEELTRLIHGEAGLAAATQGHRRLLRRRDRKPHRRPAHRHLCRRAQPRRCPRDRLAGDGLPLVDALVESGLAKSKSEARRTIAQGGAYVNNRPRTDVEHQAHPRRPRQRNHPRPPQRQEKIRPPPLLRNSTVDRVRKLLRSRSQVRWDDRRQGEPQHCLGHRE